jgi:hypothetical protein
MPADIATTLAAWVSTSGSNAPSGTTSVSSNLDDNVREMQGVIVRGLSHKGADIASATTTDIGAIEGLMHDITGTTTITGLGTVRAGIWKILKFEGVLTLTHNAPSLILPGGVSITTANGDIAVFISEGSGNWRCVSYTKASGLAPVVQPKAWGYFTNNGTASYGVTSINRTSAGVVTVTLANTMSSTNYAALATTGNTDVIAAAGSKTTTTFVISTRLSGAGSDADVNFVVFGD